MPMHNSISDYKRALLTLEYYRFTKPPLKLSKYNDLSAEDRDRIDLELNYKDDHLVEILSFIFMPNHFHFLLKQNVDGGVSKFVGQFTNSYTRYFNTRNHRVGSVFQGVFKSVAVESEQQLLHLSRYIHLNPYVSKVVTLNDLANYPWSSLPIYLGGKSSVVNNHIIRSGFSEKFSYKDFVFNHSDYARELEIIKHQVLDIEP